MAHYEGNGNDNTIYGSVNADDIDGKGGKDWLYGDSGNDDIDGGIGDDFLFGGDGDDILFGNKGNDVLQGGLGADQLKGGKGEDTADYSDATSGVTAWLHWNNAGGYATGDTYVNVENVIGSAFADNLQADFGGKAFGGGGNDTIYGASLAVGDGGLVRGDAGNDTLVMNYGDTTAWIQNGLGSDTIDQFTEHSDMLFIDLSDFGFGNSLDNSELTNSDSITAVGGNAQLIYEGDSNRLWFDSNGSTAGGLTLLATFSNSTIYGNNLDLSDFEYQV